MGSPVSARLGAGMVVSVANACQTAPGCPGRCHLLAVGESCLWLSAALPNWFSFRLALALISALCTRGDGQDIGEAIRPADANRR